MIQNQITHATSYNRYPKIFKEVSTIIPNPRQILSFGCSNGSECNTFHEIYFKNSNIIGLDINQDVINQNKENNKYENIKYVDKIEDIDNKCDLIFVMSVLCVWPERLGEYTYETFLDTLNIIDNLLEINGYLCIYNSKYLFTDTEIFKKKYKIIETKVKETGFVYKYNYKDVKIKDNTYPYLLFQKINI
jgi:chemotaxis methyl-accepting protein methylase